jgi:anti-anti-sigma factor
MAGPGTGAHPIRLTVAGELDSASAPRLLDAIRSALAGGRVSAVTLDLEGLEFIDSTGMRALVEIERELEQHQVRLDVVPAPEPVTELLHLAGVAERLRLVEDGQTEGPETAFLERVDIELAGDEQAPSHARRAVRELLEGILDRTALAAVVLMTSELVTNAVTHGSTRQRSTIGVRVVVFPRRVRVEVDDPGRGFDPAEHIFEGASVPGPGAGGRGLFVVDRSAARWGGEVRQTDRGRRFLVWFEIERG